LQTTPTGKEQGPRSTYIVPLDPIFSLREFNLFIFDDQVRTEESTSDFPAILAVADMTATLRAEKVVVSDTNGHGATETGPFHSGGPLVLWGSGSRLEAAALDQ